LVCENCGRTIIVALAAAKAKAQTKEKLNTPERMQNSNGKQVVANPAAGREEKS
jgi:hypothetical protein